MPTAKRKAETAEDSEPPETEKKQKQDGNEAPV